MQPKLATPRPARSAPANRATAAARSGLVKLLQAPAVVALAAVLSVSSSSPTAQPPKQQQQQAAEEGNGTLCNVPPTLSGDDKQQEKIKHPKSAMAMRCTSKCVSTCVLGGAGSPGIDGPFNVRRPLVVFKEDFRSRQYCLLECSDICNLIKDGEDGQ